MCADVMGLMEMVYEFGYRHGQDDALADRLEVDCRVLPVGVVSLEVYRARTPPPGA